MWWGRCWSPANAGARLQWSAPGGAGMSSPGGAGRSAPGGAGTKRGPSGWCGSHRTGAASSAAAGGGAAGGGGGGVRGRAASPAANARTSSSSLGARDPDTVTGGRGHPNVSAAEAAATARRASRDGTRRAFGGEAGRFPLLPSPVVVVVVVVAGRRICQAKRAFTCATAHLPPHEHNLWGCRAGRAPRASWLLRPRVPGQVTGLSWRNRLVRQLTLRDVVQGQCDYVGGTRPKGGSAVALGRPATQSTRRSSCARPAQMRGRRRRPPARQAGSPRRHGGATRQSHGTPGSPHSRGRTTLPGRGAPRRSSRTGAAPSGLCGLPAHLYPAARGTPGARTCAPRWPKGTWGTCPRPGGWVLARASLQAPRPPPQVLQGRRPAHLSAPQAGWYLLLVVSATGTRSSRAREIAVTQLPPEVTAAEGASPFGGDSGVVRRRAVRSERRLVTAHEWACGGHAGRARRGRAAPPQAAATAARAPAAARKSRSSSSTVAIAFAASNKAVGREGARPRLRDSDRASSATPCFTF